eukprot:tig00001525_g9246.t1
MHAQRPLLPREHQRSAGVSRVPVTRAATLRDIAIRASELSVIEETQKQREQRRLEEQREEEERRRAVRSADRLSLLFDRVANPAPDARPAKQKMRCGCAHFAARGLFAGGGERAEALRLLLGAAAAAGALAPPTLHPAASTSRLPPPPGASRGCAGGGDCCRGEARRHGPSQPHGPPREASPARPASAAARRAASPETPPASAAGPSVAWGPGVAPPSPPPVAGEAALAPYLARAPLPDGAFGIYRSELAGGSPPATRREAEAAGSEGSARGGGGGGLAGPLPALRDAHPPLRRPRARAARPHRPLPPRHLALPRRPPRAPLPRPARLAGGGRCGCGGAAAPVYGARAAGPRAAWRERPGSAASQPPAGAPYGAVRWRGGAGGGTGPARRGWLPRPLPRRQLQGPLGRAAPAPAALARPASAPAPPPPSARARPPPGVEVPSSSALNSGARTPAAASGHPAGPPPPPPLALLRRALLGSSASRARLPPPS